MVNCFLFFGKFEKIQISENFWKNVKKYSIIIIITERGQKMDFSGFKNKLEAFGYVVKEFENKEQAAAYLDQQIDGKTVGMGSSMSAKEMCLYEKLAAHNTVYLVMAPAPAVKGLEARDKAHTTDVYISSVNGAAETGELINIDNTGNRVAETLYGHKTVYLIIGENKVKPDFETALYHARNVASPKNAQRLGLKTPCAIKGDKCYNCNSPQRICRALTVFWQKPVGSTYEIILVHENLGY